MALYSCLLVALPRSAGGLDVVRAFYVTWFEQAFRATDYALWKALLLQLSNFVATFTWSFMDMYVTLVSMALTEKYLQLGEGLRAVRGKVRRNQINDGTARLVDLQLRKVCELRVEIPLPPLLLRMICSLLAKPPSSHSLFLLVITLYFTLLSN
jgi:hypothetical protein